MNLLRSMAATALLPAMIALAEDPTQAPHCPEVIYPQIDAIVGPCYNYDSEFLNRFYKPADHHFTEQCLEELKANNFTTRSYHWFEPKCTPIDSCMNPLNVPMLDEYDPTPDYFHSNMVLFNNVQPEYDFIRTFMSGCSPKHYYRWFPKEGKSCRQGSLILSSEKLAAGALSGELDKKSFHSKWVKGFGPINVFETWEYSMNRKANFFKVHDQFCLTYFPFFRVDSEDTVTQWVETDAYLCSGGDHKQTLIESLQKALKTPGTLSAINYQITLGTKAYTQLMVATEVSHIQTAIASGDDVVIFIKPLSDDYQLTLPSITHQPESGNVAFIGLLNNGQRPTIEYRGNNEKVIFNLGGHVHSENIVWIASGLQSGQSSLFQLPENKTLFDYNSLWHSQESLPLNTTSGSKVLHVAINSDIQTPQTVDSSDTSQACTLAFKTDTHDGWNFNSTFKTNYQSTCTEEIVDNLRTGFIDHPAESLTACKNRAPSSGRHAIPIRTQYSCVDNSGWPSIDDHGCIDSLYGGPTPEDP